MKYAKYILVLTLTVALLLAVAIHVENPLDAKYNLKVEQLLENHPNVAHSDIEALHPKLLQLKSDIAKVKEWKAELADMGRGFTYESSTNCRSINRQVILMKKLETEINVRLQSKDNHHCCASSVNARNIKA